MKQEKTTIWDLVGGNQGRKLENQIFPAVTDMGSPLVRTENGKQVVVGVFLEQTNRPVALYAQLNTQVVNWIYKHADWTQADIHVADVCLCCTSILY